MIGTVLAGLVGVASAAQEPMERAGLLLGSATIAPGLMVQHEITNIYLIGDLAYFVENDLSFRGRGTWYMDAQQDPALLAANSRISFGPWFHTGRGRLDLHAGFEPGVAFARPALPTIGLQEYPLRALPSIGAGAGITWYVWDYFHFFFNARYERIRYPGAPGGTLVLDESVLAGGLGLQFKVRR